MYHFLYVLNKFEISRTCRGQQISHLLSVQFFFFLSHNLGFFSILTFESNNKLLLTTFSKFKINLKFVEKSVYYLSGHTIGHP